MPDAADCEMMRLPQGELPVRWRRSARARRVSLRIDSRAAVVVLTLPPRAGRSAGMALLRDHAAWAADRLAAIPDPLVLADGVVVPIDGEPHRIAHRPQARGGAWIEGSELVVAGNADFLARRVLDFLRAEARRRFGAASLALARRAGLPVRRVVVKDTRSRWGSASANGTLMFSWRLLMAPPLVQDYVVAHEVAHLGHMNHGPAFWALVASLTPHRRAAEAWLGAHGQALMRVG